MNPEHLARELGEMTSILKTLVSQIDGLHGKLENICIETNTHCNKIATIEKTCGERLSAIKWVIAFIISFVGTTIAYIKL